MKPPLNVFEKKKKKLKQKKKHLPCIFCWKKRSHILNTNTRTFSVQSEEQILQGIHEDHSPRSFHWVTRSPGKRSHGLDRGGVFMKFLLDRGERTVFENSTGFEKYHKPPNQKEKHPSEFNELKKTLQATGCFFGSLWGGLLSLLFPSGVPCQKTPSNNTPLPKIEVVPLTYQEKPLGGATLKTGNFLCVRFTSGGCLQKTFVKKNTEVQNKIISPLIARTEDVSRVLSVTFLLGCNDLYTVWGQKL